MPKEDKAAAPMSIDQFRASMTIIDDVSLLTEEKILCYGGFTIKLGEALNIDDLLHIVQRSDKTFYLQIGNMEYISELSELEQILYEWAKHEEWI
jgi:hypothetical protein